MGSVVATSELLVVCELRLYEVKLLLAHDGWHLGDGDPLLWGSEAMSPTPSPNRGQWRVPLMRRCDSAAPDVDRSRVDRVGHNSPHTGLIPATATGWARNLLSHYLFGHA